jgi:hypothetical protein
MRFIGLLFVRGVKVFVCVPSFRWRVFSVVGFLFGVFFSARPDPRLADAIGVIRAARRPDGTWLQERRHAGRVWFEVDVAPGEPSKWLTFFGTRVLAWWDGEDGTATVRPRNP